jgi:hypothetical protein
VKCIKGLGRPSSFSIQSTQHSTHSASDQRYTAIYQTFHCFISLYLGTSSATMFISKLSLLAFGFSGAVQSISTAPNNYPRQIQPQAPQLSAEWVPWERINRNETVGYTSIPCRNNHLTIPLQALLIVDHQVGLFQLARDWDATLFKQNMKAHATIGKLFDLPVVITSSAETGPNGPVLKEFVDMFPNAPYIKRGGEVKCVFSLSNLFRRMLTCARSAWDNAEFRAAVQATGKKQFIIAGIVTDVCTAFLALSLRSEGYVFLPPPHLHPSLKSAQIFRFCQRRGQRHYHRIHSRHCKSTHASCRRTPCVLVCNSGGSHARLENGVAYT